MPYLFYYHCRQTVFISLLLICLSIGCGIAYAAVVVDNTSTVFNQNPDTLTVSHTTSGIDRLMIVAVSMLNNRSEVVTSVTYGGTALNSLGAVEQSNDSRVELWSYVNPPITTADVIVNFDQRVQDGAGFGVITFTGVDPGSPFGSFQSQTGQSSTASINVTSATGELVLGVMVAKEQDNSPSTAAGTPRWSYKVQNGNNKTVGAGATADGAANTTLTWGLNESDNWAVGAISIRPRAVIPMPLGEYRFDELSWNGTTGEVGDSSGNNNNGVAVGGITTVAGKICNAANIPGNTNAAIYEAVDTGLDLDSAIGSRGTISLWYKSNSAWNAGPDRRLFSANDGSKYFLAEVTADGRVKFWFEDGSDGDYQKITINTFTVGAGVWKHLTFAWDVSSRTAKIYVDGVEQTLSGGTGNTSAFNGFDTLYFGDNRDASYITGQSSADGLIDEALVFDSVLTTPQIQTIYSNQEDGNNYDGSARICPAPTALEMDAGQVDLPDTSVSSNFTTVNFATGFTVAPLVFTLPTLDGSDPAALRIRNVTTSSFDIAYVEPNSENGTHPGGRVDWFAITPGDHTLPDGTRLLARTIDTMRFQTRTVGGTSWEDITFAPAFAATPAVVAMVQTMNNESGSPPGSSSIPWLTTAMRGVTRSDMDLALERAESRSGTVSTPETIAYLAMDAGVQGTFPNGLDYETLISADRIRGLGTCENTVFQGSYSGIPLVIASQNRRDGSDGGWVRRCNIDETQVGLVIDEDQDRDNERNHTTEQAGILVIAGITQSLSYFSINHDNSGIHCLAEPVSVTARNADNTIATGYIGTITLDTQPLSTTGTWALATGAGVFNDATANDGEATYTFDATDNGVATFTLFYPEGEDTFDIDVFDGAIRDDDLENDITFSANGFTITASELTVLPPNDPVLTQIAGTAFDVYITAYGELPNDSACGIIETYTGNKNLTLSTAYDNPISGTVDIRSAGSLTTTLNFSGGKAGPLTVKYKDVGSIALGITEPAFSDISYSNNVVVRPASFEITPASIPPPTNPFIATGPSGTIFTTAGSDFNVTVTAKDSEGDTTPNYGNENTPETIAPLTRTLNQPSGGSPGIFVSSALLKSSSGIFSGTANWNEVGTIDLSTDVGDGNYLNTGNVTGIRTDVGRFTPATLEITSISDGQFISKNSLSTPSFSYVGQPFSYDPSDRPSFRVRALNASSPPAVTVNYTGTSWGKLSAGSINFTEPTSDTSQDGETALTKMALDYTQGSDGFHDPATNLSPVAVNGIFEVSFTNDEFIYTKDSNSQISPFNPSVNLIITNVIDGDGIGTGPLTLNPTGTEFIRFGRMRMFNAHGSELLPLLMDYRLEYFDSGNWLLNEDIDSTIDTGDISSNPTDTSATAIATATPTGKFAITLSAPGTGNDGAYLITTDVLNSGEPWLRYDWDTDGNLDGNFDDNPSATATFGIYKGNEVNIYIQQTFQ